MKRAILIGFVAMAPVAACGSDGTSARRSTLADPVGGQPPPSDPNSPPSDPQAPPTDPNAPPADPNAPAESNTNPRGGTGARGPALNCSTLCANVGSCLPTCTQYCTQIGGVTGPCVASLNAFLACAAGAFTLSCNDRGNQISINLVNPCANQARAAIDCLGIDISIRTPQNNMTGDQSNNTGGQSNNGPPPGR